MGEEGTCSVIVEVKATDPRTAESLARSLNVDNRTAPPGVNVRCEPVGPILRCEVTVKGCDNPRRLLTARNTVDDLLLGLRAALSSISAVDGTRKGL
ncbi:MAG: KEOPS complex subunit Pcc1 [Acidilobus sp.]